MDYRDKSLVLVIFGITGDLAKRKLLPALYHLHSKKMLPESFKVVGVSRNEVSVDAIYEPVKERIARQNYDDNIMDEVKRATTMVQLDMHKTADFEQLLAKLKDMTEDLGPGVSRLYYLSIPAQACVEVVKQLGATNHDAPFAEDADQPRVLIEKPFGHDVASAQELVDVLEANFGEQQTFRIDHYLAKETAQNILTFRFRNPLFQSIWNARHIEKIHIAAYETIGIEGRVDFYEQTGALRDILQSHLMQLMALITMEAPAKLDSPNIHKAKLRVLESVEPIAASDVTTKAFRAQYDTYETEVGHQTTTETFARLHLSVDNEQWRGVDICLETGKALANKATEITVYFRGTSEEAPTNALIFRIQPREGITLLLQAKQPGLHNDTDVVEMDFDYDKSFGNSIDAYERVIVDAIRGDQALFASAPEVMASWHIVEHVLQDWTKHQDNIAIYESGTPPADL